jgi:uncharacterized delta-60 repeat protein
VRSEQWRTLWVPLAVVGFVVALAAPALAAPGDLDASFNDDGLAVADFGTVFEGAEALAVGADGSVLIVGGIDQGGPDEELAMARFTEVGQPDTTFSGDGLQLVPSLGFANGVALQADGKIVVVTASAAVGSNRDWMIARFQGNGALDPTFGGGDGIVQTDFNSTEADIPSDILVQPDGKIVAVGLKGLSDGYVFAAARYEDDGDLDPGFGHGGKAVARVRRAARASAVALQANGKIVLVGESQGLGGVDWTVVRFRSDGTLDPRFSGDGKLRTGFGKVDRASDVVVQSDGKIVVVGQAGPTNTRTFDFGAARYLQDGTLDRAFGTDGRVRTDFKGEEDWARGVAVRATGKILLGGYAQRNGSYDFAIAQYTTEGKPSLSFGNEGKLRTDFGAHRDDLGFDIALQQDGRLLVAGWARPVDGFDGGVARYLMN